MKNHITIPGVDVGIVIGRFQVFHNGHYQMIKAAASLSKKLIICIGSVNKSPSPKNPFTPDFRKEMIVAGCDFVDCNDTDKVQFVYLNDFMYEDNKWLREVQEEVANRLLHWYGELATEQLSDLYGNKSDKIKVGLFGHLKDQSSYYLHKFPQWQLFELPGYDEAIHATELRDDLWGNGQAGRKHLDQLEESIPREVFKLISKWTNTHGDIYQWLSEEDTFAKNYYDNVNPEGSHEYIRHTADAVVTCKGHILLIQRGKIPGEGLWALPGGHLEGSETLAQAALRELIEEAGSRINPAVLHNAIRGEKNFDHPQRSLLCRTITTAFYFPLNFKQLPLLVAADDAMNAKWVTFNEFETMWFNRELFEDHGDIGSYYINSEATQLITT